MNNDKHQKDTYMVNNDSPVYNKSPIYNKSDRTVDLGVDSNNEKVEIYAHTGVGARLRDVVNRIFTGRWLTKVEAHVEGSQEKKTVYLTEGNIKNKMELTNLDKFKEIIFKNKAGEELYNKLEEKTHKKDPSREEFILLINFLNTKRV